MSSSFESFDSLETSSVQFGAPRVFGEVMRLFNSYWDSFSVTLKATTSFSTFSPFVPGKTRACLSTLLRTMM